MLQMLSFLTSPQQQLAAAKEIFTHVAESLDSRVSVELWDGSRIPLGRNVDPNFYVSIRGPGAIGSLLRRPSLDTLMRLYATGQIDFHGGDLIEFYNTARVENSKARLKNLSKTWLLRQAIPLFVAPAEKTNKEHGYAGQRNNRDYIQFHYDLGNDFYQLFLDPEMQYSCAYFTDWNNSLEQAQQDKLEMTCRKLRLEPGERLLDIGCGWGGLICHAAQNHGVHAHGVTLSQTQLEFTQEKIRRLGLEDRVTVELRDYSTLDGTYDKISSIGMYEHVGIKNYPAYFGKIWSLLRDRGILLNHGITRPAKNSSRGIQKARPEERFLTKYIFPGGELDNIGHTCKTLEECRFEVHDCESWREHYILTLRYWCQRLAQRKEEAIKLVGPERYRLWAAYLAGCSFGFHDGSLRIFQVVASKMAGKGRSQLPPTRADLYRHAA
ncbi:MAG: class I SAM-dependent methyltransferase [Pirellulaceae bacterium]